MRSLERIVEVYVARLECGPFGRVRRIRGHLGWVVRGERSQAGLKVEKGMEGEGELNRRSTTSRTNDNAVWVWGFCHRGYVFVGIGFRLAGLLWLLRWAGWFRYGMR